MDSTSTTEYRLLRAKRLEEALSRQPKRSQEEAYAQYDRKMGVTSQPLPTKTNENPQQQE